MGLSWWQRLPSRLLREEEALQELRSAENPLLLTHRWARTDGDEPRLFAQIRVGARIVDLEIRFPSHYPEGCPSVRPVPHDTRISTHQFPSTGVLCLELGPDNWHPNHTAADMIESAWNLVLHERLNEISPIEIPSRHVASLADRVALADGVLLRSRAFDALIDASTGHVAFEVVWMVPHLSQVLPVAFPKGTPLVTPPSMHSGGHRLPAHLVHLPIDAPSHWEVPEELAAFLAFVEKFGGVSVEDKLCAVVLRWPSGNARGYLVLDSKPLKLEDMPLETEDTTRIPTKLHSRALGLTVGVVGLGSLGSKVAVSLARAGVRQFVLVDGDVMQGENVSRHQGSYRDVGAMKVHVAKRLIADVSASEPEVQAYVTDLGAATNPDYHAKVVDALATCDVLVDASANPDAFTLLAGLASDHKRSLVWAEVFGGGLGGLVGSAHPDHSPCPRCVRAGFHAAAAAWPPAPHVRPAAPYAAGEDAALVATDSDVGLLAAALTNRIHTLVADDAAGIPAVTVLGLKRGWIFESPMQIVPVHIRSDDRSCERCWIRAADPDPAVATAAEELLKNHTDAHDPAHA